MWENLRIPVIEHTIRRSRIIGRSVGIYAARTWTHCEWRVCKRANKVLYLNSCWMLVMDLKFKETVLPKGLVHHVTNPNTWERFQSDEIMLLGLFWDSNLTPISGIYLIFKLNYVPFLLLYRTNMNRSMMTIIPVVGTSYNWFVTQ